MPALARLDNFQRGRAEGLFDEGFYEATRDLLWGWAKGNMIAYQYSVPLYPEDPVRGALLWEEFAAAHKDYYQSHEAEQIIEKACRELPDIINIPVYSYVDIGPGPARSVAMKTAKLVRALKPRRYMPSDVNLGYVEAAAAFVKEHHRDIHIVPSLVNVLEGTGSFETDEGSFYFLDGSTLMNIPEDEQTPNVETGLRRNLWNMRRLMGGKGYLAFVHDTNQNEESLNRLYRHPVQDAFILNVLHRMARDLPMSGLDPNAFSYELAWLPERHLVAHRAVCEKDQVIVLGDLKTEIRKGEKLQLTHSYKLPASKVLAAAKEAGFEPVESWDNGNGRLVFQLFRAAPETRRQRL